MFKDTVLTQQIMIIQYRMHWANYIVWSVLVAYVTVFILTWLGMLTTTSTIYTTINMFRITCVQNACPDVIRQGRGGRNNDN